MKSLQAFLVSYQFHFQVNEGIIVISIVACNDADSDSNSALSLPTFSTDERTTKSPLPKFSQHQNSQSD